LQASEVPSTVERAVTRYQLARSYYEAGDFEATLSVLEPIDASVLPAAVAGRIEYARASSHQQLRQYDRGLEALERAAAWRDGASFDARVRWKRIALRTQAEEWDEALADFRQWEPSGQDAVWYYRQAGRQLAEAAFAAGQYEQACSAFALLVTHLTGPPDMAHGLAGMAWCYLRQQNWTTAADLFQRLTEQFPESAEAPAALLARAYSLESMNDLEPAARTYGQIIERFPASPQRWLADLKLAELLQRLDQLDAAAGVLEAGLGAAEDDGPRDRLRYQLAMIRQDLGQTDASRELLRQLHTAGQGGEFWADATYRLSQAALDDGDPSAAERLVDELIAARADNRAIRLAPYGIYLKARIAAQRGEWAEVLNHLDNLQVAYSDSSLVTAARVWSIEALHRLGDHDNVRHRARTLIESQVPLRQDWQRLIDLRDAQAIAESGQSKEAIDRARALADGPLRDRFWAEAVVLSAYCEVRLGRYARAHELLRKVLDDPIELDRETHNACWSSVGDAHLAQGNYQQALDAYLHVRPHPDSSWYASAVMGVVESLEKLGRDEEARVVLRRLADSHLNSLDRSRAGELMRRWKDVADGEVDQQIPVSTTSPD
jgi:tetratricopeptide (TPR) repeat protein